MLLSNLCQASTKRLKDPEVEGDSKVDGDKSNAEAKLNDVAGPESKEEAQEDAPEGGQLTADKVRHDRGNDQDLKDYSGGFFGLFL